MDTMQGKVLIVEDDTALRHSLRSTLSIIGFDIGEAGTGEEALIRLRMVDYDAVLLDINMPGMGGLETCSRMRRVFTRLPILILTVRSSEDDEVQALESGADDYITKPFQVRELTARLRAAIRRYHAPAAPAEMPITIGDLTLDTVRHEVRKEGLRIRLTPHEFDALKLLMSNSGQPVTYNRFHAILRPSDDVSDRAYLRVLIGQLRKKLGDDSNSPTYIETEGSIGYRFRDPWDRTISRDV
jgi:two-component system, OmpR family, KDP operon response regulator KdpE